MFVRFKCRYPANSGNSAPRLHRHNAVLSPVALTLAITGGELVRAKGACVFFVRIDGVVSHLPPQTCRLAFPSVLKCIREILPAEPERPTPNQLA